MPLVIIPKCKEWRDVVWQLNERMVQRNVMSLPKVCKQNFPGSMQIVNVPPWVFPVRTRNLVWWTYIDYIFAVWIQNKSFFLENLNRHHPTIKYTASWSAEPVVHQDTRVYLNNGHIETDLHVKPTNWHRYIGINTCHSKYQNTAKLTFLQSCTRPL